jgi:hypothetical protein
VVSSERDLEVRFQKRAHSPWLLAAGFATTDLAVPWLGGKRLPLVFGSSRGVNHTPNKLFKRR